MGILSLKKSFLQLTLRLGLAITVHLSFLLSTSTSFALATNKFDPVQLLWNPDTLSGSDTNLLNRRGNEVLKSNNAIVNNLLDLIYCEEEDTRQKEIYAEQAKAYQKFSRYAGRIIADIQIVRLKPFGEYINDTTLKPENSLQKFGNSLHSLTLRRSVENNLLFSEGQELDPVDLVETEQLLRNLLYIEDVGINIEPLQDTNYVKATVVTKDKWTLNMGVRIESSAKGRITLSERNFAGIGIGATGRVYYDEKQKEKWGYMGELNIPNIAGTFITSDLWFREGVGYKSYCVDVKRDFYASKTKYALGGTYVKSQEPYKIFPVDSIVSIDYSLMSFWVGRSFRVGKPVIIASPYIFTLALKYRQVDFYKSLPTSMNLNPYFHSNYQVLLAAGFSNQNFAQDNFIYSFGATEDIPVGFIVQLIGGVEDSEYQRRLVAGGEISAAEITPAGYLFIAARTGGYMAEGPRAEQGMINFKSTFISNKFTLGKYFGRQHVGVSFTRGFSRFEGEREYLALNKDNGITGLRSNSLVGQTRLIVNFETTLFSPHLYYGFRPSCFAFCDLGMVGGSNEVIFGNSLFSGFGLGFKVKNESLIFPSFIFRLGYYPNVPQNADVAYWIITSQDRKKFEQFRMKEPALLPFE